MTPTIEFVIADLAEERGLTRLLDLTTRRRRMTT